MNKNDKADIHSGIAWAITFALVAIIMSIIAIATRYPKINISMDYMVFIVILLIISIVALAWQSCRHSERLKKHDRCARLFARRVVNHNISQNNDNKNLALHNIETNVDEILHEAKGFVKFCKYACWVIIPFCLITSIAHCVVLFPRLINQETTKEGQSRYAHLGIDYLGLIVAIFAIIVTLLVTWQIYSTIKAKEELEKSKKDIEKRFNDRLVKLEECCSQGRQRLSKLDGLEDNLKDTIYFEVYYAITGNELIKDIKTENWIKDTFISYTNPFSQSLRTIARQFLLAEFSKHTLEENSDSFINDAIKKVPKSMVEAFREELSEDKEWTQYTASNKILELIDKILKSYPKESK